jgi:hypothetical protein
MFPITRRAKFMTVGRGSIHFVARPITVGSPIALAKPRPIVK